VLFRSEIGLKEKKMPLNRKLKMKNLI